MGATLSGIDEQVAGPGRVSRVPRGSDPCINCLRIELGERVCANGICEDCGATPPSLQWMYPEGPPGGDTRSGARRRRSGWLRSIRSSSSDRPMAIPNSVASAVAARRLSVDVGIGWGVTQARLDRASFSYNYRPSEGPNKEKDGSQSCVICLGDFISGNMVRRLACLHLFHTSCVDNWLLNNRVCPVCRVDVEASAAQFRQDWPLSGS